MIFTLTRFVLLGAVILFASCARKTVLQGRIVIAPNKLRYLTNQTLFLRTNYRTVSSAKIDGFGYFEFRNVRKRKTYSIEFDSLPRALEGTVFYIASLDGKKIKEINLSKSFEYQLLSPEIWALSLEDDDLEERIREFKNSATGHELLVKKYINYDVGSYQISRENRKYMNTLARIMKENPQFVLKVSSHADANGNDDFNLALSVKRANEIKNYLTRKGIVADRIFTYGYGETRPLNHCTNGVACSDLLHKQNRRTEFVFKVKK